MISLKVKMMKFFFHENIYESILNSTASSQTSLCVKESPECDNSKAREEISESTYFNKDYLIIE